MGLLECAAIVGVSLSSALLSEYVSWFFLYGTDEYKKVASALEAKTEKLREIRRQLASGIGKRTQLEANAKAVQADSAQLRSKLTFRNMIPSFILFVTMMAIYWWISGVFDGEVVALLPFETISFFRGVTHRGIAGENFYQCSVAGIFALSSMGLRAAFTKAIGHKTPGGQVSGGSGMFDMSAFQQQIEDAQMSQRVKAGRR